MSHREPTDELAEQAALYALGSLDAEEARRFEVHLAEGCQVCERELRTFASVVGHLGVAGTPESPRPEVRRRLLDAVAQPGPLVIPGDDAKGWEPTEVPGFSVKRLFGDEAGRRVMRLGRLAAGATVQAHRHVDTEELYVIDGDLTVDGRRLAGGDYCAAIAESVHTSISSEAGCTFLLLSAEQNAPVWGDAAGPASWGLTFVLASEGTWRSGGAAGVVARRLFVDPTRATTSAVVRMEPGASLPRHRHLSSEQFYVLGGEARLDGQPLKAGDFYRAAAGTAHEVSWTERGCTFLLIASSVEALA